MNNITLESSTFAEQLGIYDFFNVLVAGTVALFTLCWNFPKIKSVLWRDKDFFEGITILLIIYILGQLLQEMGSLADKYIFHVKDNAFCNCLKYPSDAYTIKDRMAEAMKRKRNINPVIHNNVLLEYYRSMVECEKREDLSADYQKEFNDGVNRWFISRCQYQLIANGKDKKMEKMRALYSMSRTLATFFGLYGCLYLWGNAVYFGYSLFAINDLEQTRKIVIASIIGCPIFTVLFLIFRYRTTKCMNYMILTMLGVYDAQKR